MTYGQKKRKTAVEGTQVPLSNFRWSKNIGSLLKENNKEIEMYYGEAKITSTKKSQTLR